MSQPLRVVTMEHPHPEPLPQPESQCQPLPEPGRRPQAERQPLPEPERWPQPQRQPLPQPESQRQPLPEPERRPQPQAQAQRHPLPDSQRERQPQPLQQSLPLPLSQPLAHRTEPPAASVSAREFLETLTRVVLEVLAGVRDIDQIARWVSEDVYKNLSARVTLSSRARQVTGQRILRPTFCIGRTVLSEPLPGVIEGVVIVHGKARSRAVALRLEHLGTRWRASAITVL